MNLATKRNHTPSLSEAPVLFTDIPGMKLLRRGKDKDVYDLGDMLLLVSTDRLSAAGRFLGRGIKGKGHIVNRLSEYWFRTLRREIPNHLFSTNYECFPESFRKNADIFDGRSMLVWKTDPLPVRCLVRGYLAGAAWREYRNTGAVCGTKLPSGLMESQRLPNPIFSSIVKGAPGEKDQNLDFMSLRQFLGDDLAEKLRKTSLRLYLAASRIARDQAVLIADTKFEFGTLGGKLTLIDECLTPDNSRFWAIERFRSGGSMSSMDKQLLVDFLDTLQNPESIPALPEEMIQMIEEKYFEIYRRILGDRSCSER